MIIFTEHSLAKLAQRRISKNLVIGAINNPDHQAQSFGNRMISYKKFKKLYLAVVYKLEGNDIVVITQHWVAKIKK